jgi:S-adenosylmethionine/arginine decarboxylase-like enzyme
MWGYHLSLDCASCNNNVKWPNRQQIVSFAKQLVIDIDMVPYGEPTVVHFGSGNKTGYTLVQLIETSNICGHFCDDTGDCYLDIFSCKPFSNDAVLELVRKYFEPASVKLNFFERQA